MGNGKVASISRAGSATVQRPTTRAGMPATVVPGGTLRSTTLPAATLEPVPISMLPKSFAPRRGGRRGGQREPAQGAAAIELLVGKELLTLSGSAWVCQQARSVQLFIRKSFAEDFFCKSIVCSSYQYFWNEDLYCVTKITSHTS